MMCACHVSQRRQKRAFFSSLICLALVLSPVAWSQIAGPKVLTTATKPETEAETPKDTLGRETPRGTVLGFLAAARKGDAQVAALYLNTPLHGASAEALARELAVVLDRGLPPRLNQLSDKPEGSLPDQLSPDEDNVGTISTPSGNVDILLERVDRGEAGRVWLFSHKTLDSIPSVFKELNTPPVDAFLPKFLVETRVLTVPLFQWLAIFAGLPLLYFLTGSLGRLIGRGEGALRRRLGRGNADLRAPQILPPPVRLLLLALVIRWLLTKVALSLLSRQFWSTLSLLIAILAGAWMLILVNGWAERYILDHLQKRAALSGSAAVLRLTRRMIDGVVLFAALLFTLHHFGVNPTAAFAGLGVGGIAVALAAQKTLENVVGGISLIADQAVHVGDTLKLGDTVGTIESVGLRSTRIRTLDRTLVTIPNGQIANMSLESLSARDRFWFHPLLTLRYETTPAQIRTIVVGVRNLLKEQPGVDPNSVRVRLLRLGAFSLDIDIFAYVYAAARDWNDFLEFQEELLLRIMEIVQQTGAEIAFPSQTMYLATDSSDRAVRSADTRLETQTAGRVLQPKSTWRGKEYQD
jgi:MscS family membrane protein